MTTPDSGEREVRLQMAMSVLRTIATPPKVILDSDGDARAAWMLKCAQRALMKLADSDAPEFTIIRCTCNAKGRPHALYCDKVWNPADWRPTDQGVHVPLSLAQRILAALEAAGRGLRSMALNESAKDYDALAAELREVMPK